MRGPAIAKWIDPEHVDTPVGEEPQPADIFVVDPTPTLTRGKKAIGRKPAPKRSQKKKGGGNRPAAGKGQRGTITIPRSAGPGQPTLLMNCLAQYGESLINPFDAPPGCLPHSPAMPSGKYKSFARGTMVVGTQGVGFVAASTAMDQDNTFGWVSGSLFAGTTLDIALPGVGFFKSNSPFTMASFGADLIQGRNVSLGIRIRYSDREVDRGGVIVPFEDPNHRNLTFGGTPIGVTDALAYETTRSLPNGEARKWYVQTWTPRLIGEYGYRDNPDGPTNLVIFVSGAKPGATFEFEIFSNYEVVGRAVPNPTPSEADDGLTSRVTGFVSELSSAALTRLQSIGIGRLESMMRKTVMDQASHLLMTGRRTGLLEY
jgi:hypothetical protein